MNWSAKRRCSSNITMKTLHELTRLRGEQGHTWKRREKGKRKKQEKQPTESDQLDDFLWRVSASSITKKDLVLRTQKHEIMQLLFTYISSNQF